MDWSRNRKILVWSTLIGIAIAIVAAGVFVGLYEVPSCGDGVQNQDEKGIDCGGTCSLVCSFETIAPRVLFVRPLTLSSGRTDIIAYIENRNTGAEAKEASYTLELYDASNAVIETKNGVLKLPVTTRPVPLFIPGVYFGKTEIVRAFITFDESIAWETATALPAEKQLSVVASTLSGTEQAPKISATIRNPQPLPILNLKVLVTVFDSQDSVMAASQTLLREVPAQGEAEAIFTWNEPFPRPYTKIEVLPLYP